MEIMQNVSLASCVIQLILSKPIIQLFLAAERMNNLSIWPAQLMEFGSVVLRRFLLVVDFPIVRFKCFRDKLRRLERRLSSLGF